MAQAPTHHSEQLLLNEIQVLLAEKRTFYALLRSAIAIFTLPLTIIAFLLATAKYHGIFEKPWLSIVLVGVLILISLLGLSMILRANRHLKKVHNMIEKRRSENTRLSEIVIE